MSMQIEQNHEFRMFRQFLELSQNQLAASMGTTQTSIARWESGISPITVMTMAHLKSLAEKKLRDEILVLFSRLKPELRLCDFQGLLAFPSLSMTVDREGKTYLGMVEIMGYRKHVLYLQIADGGWYGIDREGMAVPVDRAFMQSVRTVGRLSEPKNEDGGTIVSKDDPAFQIERIRRLASVVFPDFKVVFDGDQPFSWIRFRFDEPGSGTIIGTPSGHYHVSEIADWSDDKLISYMKALAPSFIR